MTSSIKLFQFFQKFHQTLGIHTTQASQRPFSANLKKIVFLIGCGQYILTTAVFLALGATSIFEYGLAFYLLITTINTTTIYLIFIWQSQETFAFIKNFESFIGKRVNSMVAYNELIGKIESFYKYFCVAIISSISVLFALTLPYTLVRYYIFDMGKDSFYLFSPCWYPFDWRTSSGYFVAWLAQCIGAFTMGIVNIQFSNLGFGSCWLFIAIAEDITQDVVGFNLIATTDSDENRIELKKRFCDMVQIHSDAKQCVAEFNRMNKYSLLLFFSWTMLGAASALVTLQFQLWAHDSNLFETISSFNVLLWMTGFIFLLCEPGARMTNQFNLLSDDLHRCHWYLLSIEMQQMYTIFLSETQNPIKVMSYANITCERDTSRKVKRPAIMIHKAFSYFMTIRRFKT